MTAEKPYPVHQLVTAYERLRDSIPKTSEVEQRQKATTNYIKFLHPERDREAIEAAKTRLAEDVPPADDLKRLRELTKSVGRVLRNHKLID